jgi:hypothetical protein
MQTRTITFQNDKLDAYGIPEKFYRYLVVASPNEGLGHNKCVSSILAITESPKLALSHFVADSETAAIEKAFAALRALPANKGLVESSS